jgi:hypothetical protein
MDRQKVRILFVNCPNLDVQACTYLLLAQNSVQSVVEFEVCHHWIPVELSQKVPKSISRTLLRFWADKRIAGFGIWGAKRAEALYRSSMECAVYSFLDKKIGLGNIPDLKKLVENHQEWLKNPPKGYGDPQPSLPTIVLTETLLYATYISHFSGSIGVVSLAPWKKDLSPPSALDFILHSTQRLALRLALGTDLHWHYPTRACLFDLTARLSDLKSGILVGYICAECEKALTNSISVQEFEHLRRLTSRLWLGKVEEAGSVASSLKRVFGYDLSTTKGLQLSIVDRFLELLWSAESAKFVFAVISGLLVWWLARHNVKIELFK